MQPTVLIEKYNGQFRIRAFTKGVNAMIVDHDDGGSYWSACHSTENEKVETKAYSAENAGFSPDKVTSVANSYIDPELIFGVDDVLVMDKSNLLTEVDAKYILDTTVPNEDLLKEAIEQLVTSRQEAIREQEQRRGNQELNPDD